MEMYLSSVPLGLLLLAYFAYAGQANLTDGALPRQARYYPGSYSGKYYDPYAKIPDCYIIEVCAILDETVWHQSMTHLEKSFNSALEYTGYDTYEAEKFINIYYTSLYNEIDLRYQQFEHEPDACNCFRVYLSGIKIIKDRHDSWSVNAEFHEFGKLFIDGPTALHDCGALAKEFNDKGKCHSDLSQCFTKKNIAWDEYDSGIKNKNFEELGYIRTACDANRHQYQVSLVETNAGNPSRSAAKGLGFGLGAREDSKAGCDDHAGYLMSTQNSHIYASYDGNNEWQFSHCSVNDICHYVEGLYRNCLLDNSFTTQEFFDKTCQPLPGEIFNLTEQCKIKYGPHSEPCESEIDEYICSTGVKCLDKGYCKGFIKVFSGTECGSDNKICLVGECVPSPMKDPIYQPVYGVTKKKEKDDCNVNNGRCSDTCTPSSGGVTCSCPSGFVLGSDSKTCLDNDECLSSNGGCQQRCINTPGSFSCDCLEGYSPMGATDCEDIDECTPVASRPANCDLCYNVPGSFVCDVDECEDGTDDCVQTCLNTIGSFECECLPGYEPYGLECRDIDECKTGNYPPKCRCVNCPGSFTCEDPPKSCYYYNGGCEQLCYEGKYGVECSCKKGFKLAKDLVSCEDINECEIPALNDCEQICINFPGYFKCDCCEGYKLYKDNQCNDIDECYYSPPYCPYCINTPGSFLCDSDDCKGEYCPKGTVCVDKFDDFKCVECPCYGYDYGKGYYDPKYIPAKS